MTRKASLLLGKVELAHILLEECLIGRTVTQDRHLRHPRLPTLPPHSRQPRLRVLLTGFPPKWRLRGLPNLHLAHPLGVAGARPSPSRLPHPHPHPHSHLAPLNRSRGRSLERRCSFFGTDRYRDEWRRALHSPRDWDF